MIAMNDIQKKIQEELAGIQKSKAAKYSDKQLAAFEEHGAKLSAAKAAWSPEEKAEIQAKQDASRSKVVTSEKYRKKKSEISLAKNKDPEYRKKYLEANSKKYDNPEYWENYYKGIAKRDADEEYTKKRLDASRAKICKKVHTPLGVFDSITAASKAHGMGNSETMRHRIKSPNFPDFYIVEQ
jgi:hypothetical protein